MDTFLNWIGEEAAPYRYMVERVEVYANQGSDEKPKFVSLEALGEKVE